MYLNFLGTELPIKTNDLLNCGSLWSANGMIGEGDIVVIARWFGYESSLYC